MRVEMLTFLLSGAICLGGALGVVLLRNPVHNALSLVATLFGVAVLFIAQEAYFLAAIQVIVYAGAIVVLFLFVIMLLGVDRSESLEQEPLVGQRATALIAGVAILGLSLTVLLAGSSQVTGKQSSLAPLDDGMADVDRLGRVLFTDYVFAFEVTAVLLTVAVIGAVVLSRRVPGPPIDLDEFPDGSAVEHRPLFPDSDEQALAGSDGGSLSTLDGEGGPVVDQTPDDGEGADGDGDGATTEEVAH
jgi:NADH-quinone oxidoreductase subunit J